VNCHARMLVAATASVTTDAEQEHARSVRDRNASASALADATAKVNEATQRFLEAPTALGRESAMQAAEQRARSARILDDEAARKLKLAGAGLATAREAHERAVLEQRLAGLVQDASADGLANALAAPAAEAHAAINRARDACAQSTTAYLASNAAAREACNLGANLPPLDPFHLLGPMLSALDPSRLPSVLKCMPSNMDASVVSRLIRAEHREVEWEQTGALSVELYDVLLYLVRVPTKEATAEQIERAREELAVRLAHRTARAAFAELYDMDLERERFRVAVAQAERAAPVDRAPISARIANAVTDGMSAISDFFSSSGTDVTVNREADDDSERDAESWPDARKATRIYSHNDI